MLATFSLVAKNSNLSGWNCAGLAILYICPWTAPGPVEKGNVGSSREGWGAVEVVQYTAPRPPARPTEEFIQHTSPGLAAR